MEIWPPPPSNQPLEPDTEYLQAQKKDTLACFAVAFSSAFICIVAADIVGVHNSFLNMLRMPTVLIGSILGLVRRSTLMGRLALLAPIFYLGLIVYAMLGWCGVVPQH